MTDITSAETEISLENVSVSFPIYHGGSRSLKKSLLFRGSGGQLASDANHRIVVEALRNVSMRLRDGDRVALVGRNGAGKTTLLRVMAGIYEPVVGVVRSCGRISPMFDIALGIDGGGEIFTILQPFEQHGRAHIDEALRQRLVQGVGQLVLERAKE